VKLKNINMKVSWYRCGMNNEFCLLDKVNLNLPMFDDKNGVYIIWSNNVKRVLKIGSGQIRERLMEHINNPEILIYKDLYVTWTFVEGEQMLGIEKYLGDLYEPIIGDRFPDVTPVVVNLPFGEV
jgi:hypothetical protein